MASPTFFGYIETPYDALLVLEATLLGILIPTTRRLNGNERKCIKSGDCFVFEEQASGIKRWTEGYFLVYKELEFKDEDSKTKPLYLQNGLLKKTISFQYQDKSYHLVSYYTEVDLEFHQLETPCNVPELKSLVPRPTINVNSLGGKKRENERQESQPVMNIVQPQILPDWSQLDPFIQPSDLDYFLDSLTVNQNDFQWSDFN